MPLNRDISINQGCPLDITITWVSFPEQLDCSPCSVPVSGTPVDMTGMVLNGYVFSGFDPKRDYTEFVLTCSVVNASAGVFNVYLPAISSSNFLLDPDKNDFQSPIYDLGFYEVDIVGGDRLMWGKATLNKKGPIQSNPSQCNSNTGY